MKVRSFPPVIDERSVWLVLGSMPGTASLAAHQYYGNPRNYFWRILYAMFEGGEVDERYEHRLAFALQHKVALWDAIAVCRREGSLDANIREAVPNDIPDLLRRYPQVNTIVCNGSKSYAELQRHHGKTQEVASRTVLRMPSTSPIPTPRYRGFDDRLAAWRKMLAYGS